ncbi:MAG: ATP-binding protein [Polyangiaceae bacterium]|nr:ATP-binding protein [Polyangiaceae bacterium]
MIRFVFVFIGSVGLILLMAFVAARLARVRTEGISVRLQIFIALAFIVGAFSAGLGILVLDRIEARATRLAKEAARDEASAIAAFIGGQVDATDIKLDRIVAILQYEQSSGGARRSRFTLFDVRGNSLYDDGPHPDAPGTVAMDAPIETRDGVIGRVQVIKETVIMRRLLEDFAPTVLLISAVLGAAAALAAALIGRALASPIEELTYYAERVSEGDRSAKPPAAHGLEVKRLSKAIDKMRHELEGMPYVESFAADLSHELKNPVAAIRASAEVLDEGALAEPEEAARFVRRIREATGRIEALLDELLSLARIESRGVERREAVDLASVVCACAEAHASAGAIQVLVEGEVPRVHGDRRWLSRALDNLVHNALTHGQGAQALVRLHATEQHVIASVVSQGSVQPHIRKRLFRRFVTSRGEKGGTGLGLAIVRAVGEAHGGRVEFEEREPDLVEFRLVLPRG